nr:hypothetical protein [uncultured Sphingomonas sp.]
MTLQVQRENSDFCWNGTNVANLYESGASYPSVPQLKTWGGARNSVSRQSDSISLVKAIEVIEAAQRAIAIGKPFNRHLTVHWEKAGLTDAEAADATGRLLKLIRDWLRRYGGTAYTWVRENGDDKGSHSHILFHVPRGLRLGLTKRWYRTATGWKGRVPDGALLTTRIGGTANCAFSGSDWYLANLAYVVGYVLKGVEAQDGIALELERYGVGGTITGKRLSISGSLS